MRNPLSLIIKEELIRKRGKDLGADAFFAMNAFLELGSASIRQSYRIEFAFGSPAAAEKLNGILVQRGINSKISIRGGKCVVYVKGIEGVSDLLAFIGANKAVLELNNEYAARQINSDANRAKNCDLANIDKTLDASEKQNEAIKRLIESGRLEKFSDKLYETAMARLDNPDVPLKELASMLGVSKSGIRHRLDKIVALAED